VKPLKEQALRCAIYTRKSSEEGLEQDFNSLHAQREACEAYIRSQQGEGWRLRKTPYNDGGLSGATMERPALKQLLADIEEGLVDVVVVYKVEARPADGELPAIPHESALRRLQRPPVSLFVATHSIPGRFEPRRYLHSAAQSWI
jgi:hypothetical protein